eukprot:Nk52_evm4s2578 gene=Nk52_evmTU4s2578
MGEDKMSTGSADEHTALQNPKEQSLDESRKDSASGRGLIDRKKTCPLLLRVFCRFGQHNRPEDYRRGEGPRGDICIYTWKDASLKELTLLIRETIPEAKKRDTEFAFSVVFADFHSGRYRFKDIGRTINGKRGKDDKVTLMDCSFHIGDFMDVAIYPPK